MPAPFLCAATGLTIVLPEPKFSYMTKTVDYATPNELLKELHLKLTALPIYFRSKVAEECQWSIPTYYRKMKERLPGSKTKRNTFPLLSNAEKDKVVSVFYEVMAEAWNDCQRYSGETVES